MRTLIGAYTAIVIIGCGTSNRGEEVVTENAAARAYENVLTWEEVSAIVPDHATVEDSTALADRYISDWLKEQVLLHQAESSLPENERKFEKELERYRKSLLTYAYENHFVQQRLDTTVSKEEAEAFYNENKDIFTLKDYIVKSKFCILANDTPKLKRFKKLFDSTSPEDLVALEQFCVDYGAAYYINIDEWMYVEDLLTKFPLEVYNIEGFLRHTKYAEFEQGGKLHFIRILDVQFKDNISPLELVLPEVTELILNKRKKELLTAMREQLYRDALSNKNIEKLYK
ncbi:MAG: hypothetical protein RL226_2292 [Bacteroidota bacterium]|jgi:hypothetical protein